MTRPEILDYIQNFFDFYASINIETLHIVQDENGLTYSYFVLKYLRTTFIFVRDYNNLGVVESNLSQHMSKVSTFKKKYDSFNEKAIKEYFKLIISYFEKCGDYDTFLYSFKNRIEQIKNNQNTSETNQQKDGYTCFSLFPKFFVSSLSYSVSYNPEVAQKIPVYYDPTNQKLKIAVVAPPFSTKEYFHTCLFTHNNDNNKKMCINIPYKHDSRISLEITNLKLIVKNTCEDFIHVHDDILVSKYFRIFKKSTIVKGVEKPAYHFNNMDYLRIVGIRMEGFKNSCYPIREHTECLIKEFMNLFYGAIPLNTKKEFYHCFDNPFSFPSKMSVNYLLSASQRIEKYNLDSINWNFNTVFDNKTDKILFNDQILYFALPFSLRSDMNVMLSTFLMFNDNFLKCSLIFDCNVNYKDFMGVLKHMEVYITSVNKRQIHSFYPKIEETYKHDYQSLLPQKNTYAILFKPSMYQTDNLVKCFSILAGSLYDFEYVYIKNYSKLDDNVFNILYPSCLNRAYGKDWYNYMMSGQCTAIIFKTKFELKIVRELCLKIREASQFIWTRNVIHCPENSEENVLFLNLYNF